MTPPGRPASVTALAPAAPRAEVLLSAGELARAAGIPRATLRRAVHLGLVESLATDASLFTAATAARLRRMCRLHRDLGIGLVAAAIIVDLVARLDHLDAQLAQQRGRA
jgi:hypothetical protein